MARRFERQARRQAQLQFGPQFRALDLLLQDEQDTLATGLGAARTAQRGIVQSARQGRRDIQEIYENAGLTAVVREGLDSNPAMRRLAEEMADAEAGMVERQVLAREGTAAAIRQLVGGYQKNVRRIGQERQSLAQQKGLLRRTLVDELMGEQAARDFEAGQNALDRAQDERESLRASGIDPETGRLTPKALAQQKKANAKKWLTQSQMQEQGAEFARAQEIARTMLRAAGGKPSRKLRESIERALLVGRDATEAPVYDANGVRRIEPAKIRKGGKLVPNPRAGEQVTRRAPAIDPVDPHIATAALDMVMFGRLSSSTVNMLRSLGVRVTQLPGAQFGPRQNTARSVGTNNKAPF